MSAGDLAARIASFLIEGDGGPPIGPSPALWADEIRSRWPTATTAEIIRGIEIAEEIERADEALSTSTGAAR